MKNKEETFNYYKYLQLKALDSIFNQNDIYLYRKICRWYSKEFNTPLHITQTLPFGDILTNCYEHQFEQIPYNDLIDMMIHDHLPDVSNEDEDEIDDWVESLKEEQIKTLEAKEKRQSLNNKTVPVVKNQSPTSIPPLQPEDIVMKFDDKDFNND